MFCVSLGTRENLYLSLFAPGSHMDMVRQTIETSQFLCAILWPRNPTSSTISGYRPCYQHSSNDDYYNFLLQVFPESRPGAPSTNRPAPKCGEACSGGVNVCATTDSCRCLAKKRTAPDSQDPWGLKRSRFGTSCQASYFSYASHGRGLLESGLGNISTPEIVLVEGAAPKPSGAILPLAAGGSQRLSASMPQGSITPAACACNCTYVSVQCCRAPENGMIHEPADKQLGVVDPPPGQCCDDVTGVLRSGAQFRDEPYCAASAQASLHSQAPVQSQGPTA